MIEHLDSIHCDYLSARLKARLISKVGDMEIRSSLMGEINIYNILAASAAALSLHVDLDAIAEGIEKLEMVPGRLELVKSPSALALVVDYAHTPDALLKALTTLRPIVQGRLITVFGCGGDRDEERRTAMGAAAYAKLGSDACSDNLVYRQ